MLNKLAEMIDSMNKSADSEKGFSAETFYKTGATFGLTCREVNHTFLGKGKAISYGRYPAAVSAEVLKAAAEAPVKTPKVKAPKTAKTPKAARNVSTAVIEKTTEKDKAAKASRLDLIAKIAKRHAKEAKVIADIVVASSTKTEEDDGTLEEIEKLMKAAPSTAPN